MGTTGPFAVVVYWLKSPPRTAWVGWVYPVFERLIREYHSSLTMKKKRFLPLKTWGIEIGPVSTNP